MVGKALSLPLLDQPELLEQPEWAAISAAWWWSSHRLNELADVGKFETITRCMGGQWTGGPEGAVCPSLEGTGVNPLLWKWGAIALPLLTYGCQSYSPSPTTVVVIC